MMIVFILLSLASCTLLNLYCQKLLLHEHYIQLKEQYSWFNYLPFMYHSKRVKENESLYFKRILIMNAINVILYLAFYYKFRFTMITLKYCGLTSLLIGIGFIDLNTKYIYRHAVLTVLIYLLGFGVFESLGTPSLIIDRLLGGGLTYGFIYLIAKLTGGMGEGDADIAGLCGLGLGIAGGALTLFVATISGAILGGSLILFKRFERNTEIPFVPFLALGAILSMLFQNEIINWYHVLFI